jgi:diguanylate cyclase (GGDEF)-like protein
MTLAVSASLAVARAQLYANMQMLSTTDGLTGLNNYRMFRKTVEAEFKRARRYDRPLSLLLIEADNLGAVNDAYGNQAGDIVLREIAARLKGAARASDFPARYNAETLAVILTETAEKDAYTFAERMRAAVESDPVSCGESQARATISVGCATFPMFGASPQDLVQCADIALGASKQGGRNRVSVYRPEMAVWEAFDRR